MLATSISLSNLYWNKDLAKLFFTNQAYGTFEELVHAVLAIEGGTYDEKLDELENRAISVYETIEDFAEDCHNLQVEELLEILGY